MKSLPLIAALLVGLVASSCCGQVTCVDGVCYSPAVTRARVVQRYRIIEHTPVVGPSFVLTAPVEPVASVPLATYRCQSCSLVPLAGFKIVEAPQRVAVRLRTRRHTIGCAMSRVGYRLRVLRPRNWWWFAR